METSSWTPSPPQYDEAEYLLRLSSLKLKSRGHRTRLVSTVLIRSVYQRALGVVSSPTRSPEQAWGDDVKPSPRPSMWDVVDKEENQRKRRREDDEESLSKRQRDDEDMLLDEDTTPPSPPTVDAETLAALEAAALRPPEDDEDDDSAMMLGIEYHLRRMAAAE
eukprot:comp20070_c0_seq1/m.24691 comp20070_c0_seq1/g.24691  ORF comp20070_c0_seq1/g.24691 comp20070_c0_seq1/m.24691 type:complete len:164 (-) comp20070_c0_seq1:217-708(-)